jgi:hypothetical protein
MLKASVASFTRDISCVCVCVRCSRTQSTQADVHSAVPRMASATRNLINVGRADEAGSREYAPQKPNRPHTYASVSLKTVISEACSPTLYARRRWDGDGLYATHLRMFVRVYCSVVTRSSLPSSYIYTRRGRPTDSNGRHQSYRYSQPETGAISDVCY